MHPPMVAPPTKHVDEMFDFFQANNARAVMVLNEFGGIDGLVTMRDIINFIFGEISDSVTGQDLYQEQDQNIYEVPGQMKLTDFNDLTNFGIEDPRMTTIAGVVFRYLDCLPTVGDRVMIDGLVATVLEMEGHRLAKVRIAKSSIEEETARTQQRMKDTDRTTQTKMQKKTDLMSAPQSMVTPEKAPQQKNTERN